MHSTDKTLSKDEKPKIETPIRSISNPPANPEYSPNSKDPNKIKLNIKAKTRFGLYFAPKSSDKKEVCNKDRKNIDIDITMYLTIF